MEGGGGGGRRFGPALVSASTSPPPPVHPSRAQSVVLDLKLSGGDDDEEEEEDEGGDDGTMLLPVSRAAVQEEEQRRAEAETIRRKNSELEESRRAQAVRQNRDRAEQSTKRRVRRNKWLKTKALDLLVRIPGQHILIALYRALRRRLVGGGAERSRRSMESVGLERSQWGGVPSARLKFAGKRSLRVLVPMVVVTLLLLLLLWFVCLPIVSYGTSTLLGLGSYYGDHNRGRGRGGPGVLIMPRRRVDDANVAMDNPLALNDLLYDRSTQARKAMTLMQELSARTALAMRSAMGEEEGSPPAMSAGGGPVPPPPPPPPSHSQVDSKRAAQLLRVEQRQAYLAYRQNDLWQHFIRTEMLASELEPGPETFMTWLRRQCAGPSSPRISSASEEAGSRYETERTAFLRAAKQKGHIELDVTDRFPDQPSSSSVMDHSNPWQQQQASTGGGGYEKEITQAMQSLLANAPPPPPPNAQTSSSISKEGPLPSQQPLLLSPPYQFRPRRHYRNVSLHDAEMLMRFMAVEGRAAWEQALVMETEAAAVQQRGDAIEQAVADAVAAAASMWVGAGDESVHRPENAVARMAADAVWTDEHQSTGDGGGGGGSMSELRSRALWAGMGTGCVCAAHIGLPLPAAAWVDTATGKRRALFFPDVASVQTASGDRDPGTHRGRGPVSTFLGGILAAQFGFLGGGGTKTSGSTTTTDGATPTYPHRPSGFPLRMASIEPVLNPQQPQAPAIAAAHGQRQNFLQVPHGHRRYVEGYDYEGRLRRVAVRGPELACLRACLRICP